MNIHPLIPIDYFKKLSDNSIDEERMLAYCYLASIFTNLCTTGVILKLNFKYNTKTRNLESFVVSNTFHNQDNYFSGLGIYNDYLSPISLVYEMNRIHSY